MASLSDILGLPPARERTEWLGRQSAALDDTLSYYLGPTGIPDRLNSLASLLYFTDAGDMTEAADASRAIWDDPNLANTGRYLTAAAALAMPAVSARGLGVLTDAADSTVDDLARYLGDESGGIRLTAPDPATTRGAEIIDLLTAGRASEVTDEMLDLGDPVLNARLNDYLFRNYDLPMDTASREYRASEMGFPTHKYDGVSYHLTPSDVTAFNVGHTSTPLHPREAVWTRLNPQTNPAAHNVGRDFGAEGVNDMPLYFRGNRVMPFEARDMPDGEYLPYAVSREWADEARSRGYAQYELGNERLSIEPANIRSRFARFDPRLAHLRNLSAALGGASVLPLEYYLNDWQQEPAS